MTASSLEAAQTVEIAGISDSHLPFSERIVAGLAILVLAYGIPSEWFLQNRNDLDQASGGAAVALVFGLLSLALIARLWRMEESVLHLVSLEPLVALLPCIAIFSTLWSADPATSFRRSVAWLLATLLAYYFALRMDTRRFVVFVATVGLFGTVLNLLFIFGLPEYGVSGGNYSGISVNKNVFARISTVVAFTSIFAARLDRPNRVLWWSLFWVNLLLVALSNSKTSTATLLLTLTMMIVFSSFRAKKTLYGAVVGSFVTAMGLTLGVATANLSIIAEILDRDVTLTGRVDLWRASIPHILDAPFGYGYAAFWGPLFSPAHVVYEEIPWAPPNAHNELLELALAIGWIGPIILIALVARTISRGMKLVRLIPTAAGMYPLTVIAAFTLTSLSESGVTERNILWLVLVFAVLQATAASDSTSPVVQLVRQVRVTRAEDQTVN